MNKIHNNRKSLLFIGICFFIMGLICLLVYQPLMSIFKDRQLLRQQLQSLGIFGQMILTCIMSIQVILAFLPGEIIEVMSGFIYGPILGMILCLLGSAIGSLVIYIFIKRWGIKYMQHFINIKKIEELKFLQNQDNLNILLFIIFFIPGTPKDVLTYFIPLTDIKLSTFLFITTIARIPSIITSTIGGHAIGIENYLFSMIIFIVTGIISLGGLLFYKYFIHKHEIHYNL